MQEAIDFLLEKDPVFKRIIDLYGLPIIPKRPQGFATLSLLILEQQVSIDSARAIFAKLKSKVSEFLPEELFLLSDEEYRSAGVSRQKTSYIKALSTTILNGELDLESLPSKPSQQVREELIKIKGIGNWTVDVYLLFCLNHPDVIPLGDIAIVNTIKELLGIHDKIEMEVYAQKWSPHRSIASFLLWHYYLEKRGRKTGY
ncbi:DNA-3-methyladenine glycosylase family protein [Flavobacterium sp. PLA-1-15]|uniref:DNA-3-methyladenine glycosylase family protein n=1 Tax=Flavobacterium sp. PLA-1-15 TaxID=3380533 RepID=UPI003B7701E5